MRLRKRDVRVSILDGNYLSLEELALRLKGDVIGITDCSVCHENAIWLSDRAREANPNSTIILGGPNASHLGIRILRRRSSVDLVVVGDGEAALGDIVEGTPYASVPGLCYRHGDRIIQNAGSDLPLNRAPIFDFSGLVPAFDRTRVPVPIAGIRGCIKAAKRGPCSYCSLLNASVRVMPSQQVWSQVDSLRDRYGVSYFFETGDEFLVGNYPQRLLAARPRHLDDVRWRIYSSLDALSDGAMTILKRLNVETVFVGVETITPRALSVAGRPGYSCRDVVGVADRARSANIRLIASFILGLPGEDRNSIIANCGFMYDLASEYADVFEAISVSIATPVAGSDLFLDVVSDDQINAEYRRYTGEDLATTDMFDYGVLTQLLVEHRTGVEYDWLVDKAVTAKEHIEFHNVKTSTFMGVELCEPGIETGRCAANSNHPN